MTGSGRMRAFLVVVLLVLGARGEPAAAQAHDLLVFAAASLKTALDEIDAEFTRRDGIRVAASYGASSALARQIEAGAPADLFISADLDWMDYVAERRLIKPETRANLLGNALVLIAPTGSPVHLSIAPGFPLAAALGDGRLATGDPAAVPAGKYGKAALEALGVWDSVARRLAPADNVRAALLFVARGEAPLGIVYRSDAAAEPKVRVVDTFPPATHPPIVYPAALLAGGAKGAEAARYLAYLRSAEARPAFLRQGFTMPE